MLNSWNRSAAARVVFSLAVCWLINQAEVAAQSTDRILVVAADESAADCVRRIGCEHVQVEVLFGPEFGAMPASYQACDQRVRDLVAIRLFVFRADECCSSRFWRERMAAANPHGEVHRLPNSICRGEDDCDCRIQQAFEVHRLLAAILPQCQESLDCNLAAELQRLRSLRSRAFRLAMRD